MHNCEDEDETFRLFKANQRKVKVNEKQKKKNKRFNAQIVSKLKWKSCQINSANLFSALPVWRICGNSEDDHEHDG